MTGADHVARARAAKKAEAHADGIDDAFISLLVESFYDTIRQDEMLGPIFLEHVKDWPRHLARMKDFWASIMIESGRFSGNPMHKHIAIGGLDQVHFARWFVLWDQTLEQVAPSPKVAARFREGAQRIGDSLLTGIQIDRGGLAAISSKAASSTKAAISAKSGLCPVGGGS